MRQCLLLIMWMVFILLAIREASAQYSCEQVRGYVKSVGRAQATANAEAVGATKQQMKDARGCMGKKRK